MSRVCDRASSRLAAAIDLGIGGGLPFLLDAIEYRNLPGETVAPREVLDLSALELKRLPVDTCTGYFHV